MRQPVVTRITVARLYNLGSYEHTRYELTVDVPEGQSAAKAIIGLERILSALSPKRPAGTPDADELRRAELRLNKMKSLSEDDFKKEFPPGYAKGTRKQITARYERDFRKGKRAAELWLKRKAKARELLDDLGGAARFKDAKDDWD